MRVNISGKLIVTVSLIFSVSFSLSSYLLLYNSTRNTIRQAVDASVTTYSLNYNSLKNEFLRYNIENTNIDGDFVRRTAETINSYQNVSFDFLISDADDKELYKNTDFPFAKFTNEFADTSKPSYRIERWKDKHMIILSSKFTIDTQTFRLIGAMDISQPFLLRDQQLKDYYMLCIGVQILTFLILFFLIRRITKPIQILSVASEDIAHGNYEKRTNIQSNDEVGDLSRHFDQMAEAVQTHSMTMEKMLQNREMFVGAFSHELKTPLTTIIGYSDMLLHLDLSPEDKKKAYASIYKEGRRLELLSQDLLDLLMNRHQEHTLSSISIGEVMQEINSLLNQHYEDSKIHIDIEECNIMINKDLFITLLFNLIKNAIKADPINQRIHLIGWREHKDYHLYVLDHGCGMSAEQIKHCMEPFYKADKSRGTSSGNGLGLAICKEIAEYHYFEIKVDSLKDIGTCIYFTVEVSNE